MRATPRVEGCWGGGGCCCGGWGCGRTIGASVVRIGATGLRVPLLVLLLLLLLLLLAGASAFACRPSASAAKGTPDAVCVCDTPGASEPSNTGPGAGAAAWAFFTIANRPASMAASMAFAVAPAPPPADPGGAGGGEGGGGVNVGLGLGLGLALERGVRPAARRASRFLRRASFFSSCAFRRARRAMVAADTRRWWPGLAPAPDPGAVPGAGGASTLGMGSLIASNTWRGSRMRSSYAVGIPATTAVTEARRDVPASAPVYVCPPEILWARWRHTASNAAMERSREREAGVEVSTAARCRRCRW